MLNLEKEIEALKPSATKTTVDMRRRIETIEK
jgi:hypothetical protein